MWYNAVLLTLLVAAAGGAPPPLEEEVYHEEEVYNEEVALYPDDAQMVSESQSLVVEEGANISLPCLLVGEHANDIIVLWKKQPSTILFTGPMKLSSDDRIRLGPHNELMVSGIVADDDGTYVCMVAVKPDPLELRHTVSVHWPAKLQPLDSDHYQLREGEMFELTCGANGNPEPVVTWSKLGDDLVFLPESPSKKVALTLDPVEPRHTGTYTCTAQNGIGQPDVLTAKVEVIHAPHISLEESVVRTAHGMTATVGCRVFANPRAEVIWQRNGEDLPASSRYETVVSSRYFSLKIRDVKDEDLGNYTCLAKNELGVNEHHISLTGMPGPLALHLAPPVKVEGGQQSSTTVTWEFVSYSTVEDTSVIVQPLEPAGFRQVSQVPTVTSRSVAKKGEHRLSPLNVNTTYMVRVSAKNQYGWTPPAELFFSISGGELTVTHAPPKLAESKTSGGDTMGWTLTPILLIAILSSFF